MQFYHRRATPSTRTYRSGTRWARGNGGRRCEFALSSLPPAAQARYHKDCPAPADTGHSSDPVSDTELYAAAPEHSRRKADKYVTLIRATEGMGRAAVEQFCREWNHAHPDQHTSYNSIVAARKSYREAGIAGLLGQYGKRAGKRKISEEDYETFRDNYLVEGAPPAPSAWKKTLGAALRRAPSIDPKTFPSYMTFVRAIRDRVPEAAIFLARYGEAAYRRRYGYYIKRDYSDMLAGEIWVSDHAQVDVAVSYKVRNVERYAFPWVTVWRDMKSGKWMGWDLHVEPPKSDHIFMAFHRAGVDHPLCTGFYLDNGKDYRHKDLTGGRQKISVTVPQQQTMSLSESLGIRVCFAWPYNPQSKPVERDFLRNKNDLSKSLVGYRGGNVVERPEILKDHIKAGRLIPFEHFSQIFDTWVTEVVNRETVQSGYRKGQCADEIYQREAPIAAERGLIRTVSADSLQLWCTHTGPVRKIGPRGYRDSTLGVDFFDSWMPTYQGRRVYNRTDPKRCQEAWIFDAETHESLGKAHLHPETPALARDDISREKLRQDIALKRRTDRLIKSYVRDVKFDTPPEETVRNHAEAVRALNQARGYEPQEVEIPAAELATEMDRAISRQNKRETEGASDYGMEQYQETERDDDDIDVWKIAI